MSKVDVSEDKGKEIVCISLSKELIKILKDEKEGHVNRSIYVESQIRKGIKLDRMNNTCPNCGNCIIERDNRLT